VKFAAFIPHSPPSPSPRVPGFLSILTPPMEGGEVQEGGERAGGESAGGVREEDIDIELSQPSLPASKPTSPKFTAALSPAHAEPAPALSHAHLHATHAQATPSVAKPETPAVHHSVASARPVTASGNKRASPPWGANISAKASASPSAAGAAAIAGSLRRPATAEGLGGAKPGRQQASRAGGGGGSRPA
jgi:hypothetical protein